MTATPRRYSVRARHLDSRHGHIVEEASFEAAAVAYVQDLVADDQAVVSVIVRELDSGHEHCFRIDLEHGEAGACG